MRILWVKAGKLLPVDTGGKIRSFNLLRELDAQHEVTLLSYYGGARDLDYERALPEIFPRAVPLNAGVGDSSLAMTAGYARRFFSREPYAVTKFTAPSVRRLIETWDAARRFDMLICDFLAASLNFPARLQTPSVLFQHNVESMLWRRQADTERHPLKRAIYRLEARKMERYERATMRRFGHTIAVSDADRSVLSTMVDASRISVVPTGVDTRAFRPAGRVDAPEPIVLFLGSMDWEANIDGVRFFVDEIWPAVHSAVPRARFQIVGRNPAPSVRRLASDHVEVVGTVPSVIEYLHRAAVVVVPLRVGGGTRLKIYEAMAAGKAVVSTSIGAEGLEYHNGRDIVIADERDAFAASVIRLLQHHDERRKLEEAAVGLASKYDWSVIADQFQRVLTSVLDASRRHSIVAA